MTAAFMKQSCEPMGEMARVVGGAEWGGQPAKSMRFGLRSLAEFMALQLIRPPPFTQSLGLP